ncbi:MAG: hypothetical protein WA830_06185 [Candidatus Sulfotelmatobacter sp.]
MPNDPSALGAADSPFAYPDAPPEPGKFLAAYFESSTFGLCILDSEYRYLALNNTLAEINGISDDPRRNGPAHRCVPGNRNPAVERPEKEEVDPTGWTDAGHPRPQRFGGADSLTPSAHRRAVSLQPSSGVVLNLAPRVFL